ncbi:hypothetical protein GALMADRAFT_1124346 [Galerina marginata CBS 339.88]|uniref:Uncharacterized protein n=1 Tax=Galerina marginata (strain CBS 339.88) TaxID=685588 RepID=A0A067TDI0_GALM3|nr:hypothetical protein GALMADRAFT_1124346 [Galerina marginata CBS 339.88]
MIILASVGLIDLKGMFIPLTAWEASFQPPRVRGGMNKNTCDLIRSMPGFPLEPSLVRQALRLGKPRRRFHFETQISRAPLDA